MEIGDLLDPSKMKRFDKKLTRLRQEKIIAKEAIIRKKEETRQNDTRLNQMGTLGDRDISKGFLMEDEFNQI